jgi:hypothetical protein
MESKIEVLEDKLYDNCKLLGDHLEMNINDVAEMIVQNVNEPDPYLFILKSFNKSVRLLKFRQVL